MTNIKYLDYRGDNVVKIIYVLLDPFTDELRYVGQTVNISKRYSAHCKALGKTYKDNWIRSLYPNKPILIILEEVLNIDANKSELFWIQYFTSIGCKLTNHSNEGYFSTGMSGKKHSEITKRKMSYSNKGWNLTEEQVQKRYKDRKEYSFKTPDNNIIVASNISKLALSLNLNATGFYMLISGKRKSYKGYRLIN